MIVKGYLFGTSIEGSIILEVGGGA